LKNETTDGTNDQNQDEDYGSSPEESGEGAEDLAHAVDIPTRSCERK